MPYAKLEDLVPEPEQNVFLNTMIEFNTRKKEADFTPEELTTFKADLREVIQCLHDFGYQIAKR